MPPERPALVGRAETLRSVLDDRQVVLAGNRVDRVDVGALAVQRDRHDRLGARRDRRFEQRRIHVVRARIDVDEDRPGADQRDHLGGREERERHRDDFVARPDIERHQRDQQRVGAARDARCHASSRRTRRGAARARRTSGPITYCPCSSTLAMRASTDGFKRRYWVLRSMKSMLAGPAGFGISRSLLVSGPARSLRTGSQRSESAIPRFASTSARSLPTWPEWPRTQCHVTSWRCDLLLEPQPQVRILDRLLVRRFPAALFPLRQPFRDAVANVLRVGVQLHATGALQRRQCFDRRGQLHAIVGGVRLAAMESRGDASPETSSAPQPPGPGLPLQAPSV